MSWLEKLTLKAISKSPDKEVKGVIKAEYIFLNEKIIKISEKIEWLRYMFFKNIKYASLFCKEEITFIEFEISDYPLENTIYWIPSSEKLIIEKTEELIKLRKELREKANIINEAQE